MVCYSFLRFFAHSFVSYSDDPEFRQWVPELIRRLIPILLHPKAPRSLHENAAVSIGRIGLMHPTLVAPHLPEFAQAWCQALYEIRDNEEKDSAFRGLCTLVQTNPAGMAKVNGSPCYGCDYLLIARYVEHALVL
jgi:hypothetical protein